jgi:hypothetical protein
MSRYWVGVASEEHVNAGVRGGFAQLGHGKHAPIRKLSAGDWIVYYSPRSKMKGGEPVQAFKSIGRVKAGAVYQASQGEGFRPFRRDVAYRRTAQPAAIAELRDKLSFTRDRGSHWGVALRRGLFEIPLRDFIAIAKSMKVSLPK